MSKTAARIAQEQAGQPIFYLDESKFTDNVLSAAIQDCNIPAHCTLVTGTVSAAATYNIHMPPPIEAAGHVCVVMVSSETEDGDVTINLQANKTNIVSTMVSPDSIVVVLISDGQHWLAVYDRSVEIITNVSRVPSGGTTGQILAKTSDDNFDLEWATPVVEIPAGGTIGQVLAKKSGDDFDLEWVDA